MFLLFIDPFDFNYLLLFIFIRIFNFLHELFVPMYVSRIPNRNSNPTWLIRESHRNGDKIDKLTVLNITKLPMTLILQIRELLRGASVCKSIHDLFERLESKAHGHVALVLGMVRKLSVPALLHAKNSRHRRLVLGMITSRVLNPVSKLATSTLLDVNSASSTLNEDLALKRVDADDLYEAMDWLSKQKTAIECRLAKKHLREGSMVLYDLTSSYVEGKKNELAEFGYSRDKKRGKKQIVIGLLTDPEGCPVAVDVFKGNTSDSKTLAAQVTKLRDTFGLDHVVLVGDRGVLTQKGIREELLPAGLDWITAMRKDSLRKVVEAAKETEMSLFDQQNIMQIESEHYPKDRLILCKNPIQKDKKQIRREERLVKTEEGLEKIIKATQRKGNPLTRESEIGIRVGKVFERQKTGAFFTIEVKAGHFQYARDQEAIQNAERLDGVYAIRTSLKEKPTEEEVVSDYKRLSMVEQAFRSFKQVSLKVRPIHHRTKDRVTCHVFLCMLSYYVEYHLRKVLAPILFREDDPEGRAVQRSSIVESVKRSEQANKKAQSKRNQNGEQAMSFESLLNELRGLSRIKGKLKIVADKAPVATYVADVNAIQKRAFELAGIKLKPGSVKG